MNQYRGDETILIVDDNEMVVSLFSSFLLTLGYNVITAEDGQEAVDKYRHHNEAIDYVLMDVKMPRKNGITAFFEIKEINPNAVIAMISGFPNECEDMPEVDFIQKPIWPIDLVKKIRARLDADT